MLERKKKNLTTFKNVLFIQWGSSGYKRIIESRWPLKASVYVNDFFFLHIILNCFDRQKNLDDWILWLRIERLFLLSSVILTSKCWYAGERFRNNKQHSLFTLYRTPLVEDKEEEKRVIGVINHDLLVLLILRFKGLEEEHEVDEMGAVVEIIFLLASASLVHPWSGIHKDNPEGRVKNAKVILIVDSYLECLINKKQIGSRNFMKNTISSWSEPDPPALWWLLVFRKWKSGPSCFLKPAVMKQLGQMFPEQPSTSSWRKWIGNIRRSHNLANVWLSTTSGCWRIEMATREEVKHLFFFSLFDGWQM